MENSLRSCFSLCYWTTVAASSAVVSCQWNKSVNLSAVLKKKRKSVCSAVDQDDKKPRRPGRKSENKTAATLTHTHTQKIYCMHTCRQGHGDNTHKHPHTHLHLTVVEQTAWGSVNVGWHSVTHRVCMKTEQVYNPHTHRHTFCVLYFNPSRLQYCDVVKC